MGHMYTVEDREALLTNLHQYAEGLDAVVGFLVVGSGAYGFRDEYSDVDGLVVVKQSGDVEAVNRLLVEQVNKVATVSRMKIYQHEPDIWVTCFFMHNYLNLDLGVWALDKLRATKPHWIVKFDKIGIIEEKLRTSLSARPKQNVHAIASDTLSRLWQFVRTAVVAIKRGHFIKAIKDMDWIRDQLITIICLMNDSYDDLSQNIEAIDHHYVDRLKATYNCSMTQEQLGMTLIAILELAFDVFQELQLTEDLEKHKRELQIFVKELLEHV